jgi:hypothetical protein
MGTSIIDWPQLSRLLPKDEEFPKRCFRTKHRTMDNVQKVNNCTKLGARDQFPSSRVSDESFLLSWARQTFVQ